MVKEERVFVLRKGSGPGRKVVYWMSRDQRVKDNWALQFAVEKSRSLKYPLLVVFCIAPEFGHAISRQYEFMLDGLRQVCTDLKNINIPFYLLKGDPPVTLREFIRQNKISHVITDFDPLRIKREWKNKLAAENEISLFEVDAHNVVPCRYVSQKVEFGAYTLRPKIRKLLPYFMDEFLPVGDLHQKGSFDFPENNWEVKYPLNSDSPAFRNNNLIKPGEKKAFLVFEDFVNHKLESYDECRNDPNLEGTSMLSPYLHFGQISAQRISLDIVRKIHGSKGVNSFLEELIVRRELSDNFCFYQPDYDKLAAFPAWAIKSLFEHRKDEREYLYTFTEFEQALTHDPLWNAAQNQMVLSGYMHGYMRMYWAKKILEWTHSPEEALDFCIRLNDTYQWDGRDPNGYTGCAWSIGGVHDRAWSERSVFGKIRYMNFNGCRRKFDTDRYIKKWNALKNEADTF